MSTLASRLPLKIAVTGTDTGVGKTVVSAAMVSALRAQHHSVVGYKLVETGSREDSELLRSVSSPEQLGRLPATIEFALPLAPMVAAGAADSASESWLDSMDHNLRTAMEMDCSLVLEGAGGLLTPFSAAMAGGGGGPANLDRRTSPESLGSPRPLESAVSPGFFASFASMVKKWNLDLIIVAGNRLGALNHTLLTMEAAQMRGIIVKAIVLSDIAPHNTSNASDTNQAALRRLTGSVPIIRAPFLTEASSLGNNPESPVALEQLRDLGSIILKHVL